MKRFAVALLVLFAIAGAVMSLFFFGVGYYLSPQGDVRKSDAIVAISGGDTLARTQEAVKLYQEGWAKHLIFSGAALDPNSPSNAAAMALAAEAAGVPATAIELDEVAANTRQNAAGVADIVKKAKYHSIILVTSPYHQRRASIVFSREMPPGVTILNHSSIDSEWRRSQWWATPTSRALTIAELQKVLYELVSETN